MSDVVDFWNSANGALCREGVVEDLRQRGGDLGGQITQAGKESLLSQVDFDPDG